MIPYCKNKIFMGCPYNTILQEQDIYRVSLKNHTAGTKYIQGVCLNHKNIDFKQYIVCPHEKI